MNILLRDKQLSAVKIAEQLGLGSRSIEKNIKKLKELGIIVRHGSPKSGYWEVMEYEFKKDKEENVSGSNGLKGADVKVAEDMAH